MEFTDILLRKNSLRKNTSELTSEQLSKVIADLSDLVSERKLEEENAAREMEAKKAKISEIQRLMREAGINTDQLMAMADAAPKKRVVEAKYRVIDDQGKAHEWTGRGRPPAAFKEKMERGALKEDFLIKG